MQRYDFTIRSKQEMLDVIDTFGFLPFFAGSIPGFSLEEHVSPELWYSHVSDSWPVWEWKGPVIRESGCAYGKFFENKAVFISRDWFTHLANYRRDGYDFDARFDEGLASYRDKDLFDLCYDRGSSSLWQRLNANSKYGAECAFLAERLALSDLKRPYELFGAILYEFKGKKKFLARLGSEASDALDEFMNLTLEFEVDHVPNLQNFVSIVPESF